MRRGYRKFLRYNVLAFFFIGVLLAILFIKNLTLLKQDTLSFLYSIFVTTFVLSRITGSFFYNYDNKWKDNNYEPAVSFVIPVKNEENVISNTIAKCYEVDYPKDKIEVIVINDGSTDNTLKEIENAKKIYKDLTIIDWKINKGKRYGMAEGFKIAKGEIVIQLDSDSYIEKSSLKTLIRPFQDGDIGAVAAHSDPQNANENFLTKMQAAYYFISFRAMKASESLFDTVFCCSGCCSAYRKNIVLPVLDKWINETFLSKPVSFGDDRSLTNQLLKAGHKTIYLNKAQAYTIVPNNIRQFIKQQIRWKKSWVINAIFLSQFIFKRNKFVAITYFIPVIIISLFTPFIAFKAIILNPVIFGISPIFYIIGVFLVSSLLAIHYMFFRGDKNYKYIYAWIFLGLVFTSYLMFYALLDIRNMKWGTR